MGLGQIQRLIKGLIRFTSQIWNWFLSTLGFPVQRYICFRPYVLPVVVGLCLGITIHMMFVPFMEEGCDVTAFRRAASLKSTSKQSSQIPKSSVKTNLEEGNDGFEARIVKTIPANTTVDKEAVRPKVVRPRYISNELGIREKLFVAVLTSSTTVDKLGVAVDKTLSKHVSKSIFFSTLKPAVVPNGLPNVAFGDRHPELLPIHVLKFIQEHYANNFDFYLFMTDRTYLRAEKYFNMIERISVHNDVYMGVPGLEKNYCALEGGVLLSQSIMMQVLGNLDWCLKNIHPDNPSVTLGRCVHHASQKLCSPKGGDKTLSYYQLEDFDYDDDIGRLWHQLDFNQSLTFYPMPDDISHYKLHRYFCYVDLNTTKYEIETAKQDIIELSPFSPGGRESLSWPIGVPPPYKPPNRHSLIEWTYFTETHLYLDDELTNIRDISGANKLDIADIKETVKENINHKYRSQFNLKKIINGYRRFDPTRGMEYILDLLLTDRHHRNAETIKRVHLVRPLGKVELVPMPYVTENMMVNIILPLQPDDFNLFFVFLDLYGKSCLQNGEDVRLVVVLLYPNSTGLSVTGSKDLFTKPKAWISEYSKKYHTNGKLSWKAMVDTGTNMAIMDELQKEFKTDVLILMTTVNMELSHDLTSQYLNRVRMNTIKSKQVFFPMGFWQYKPNLIYNEKPYPTSVEIGQRLGFFSTTLFDHASFYLSDYKTARKHLSSTAARSDNVFDMFLGYREFHIFRAVEPNLKLHWMNITCHPKLSPKKYQECISNNAEGLASQHHLALLIYEQKKDTISQINGQINRNPAPVPVKDVPVKDTRQMNIPELPQMINPPFPGYGKPIEENLNSEPNDPQAEGMLLVHQKKH